MDELFLSQFSLLAMEEEKHPPNQLPGRQWPSEKQWQSMLYKCKKVLERYEALDEQYALVGEQNVWILKPRGGSKGEGIQCFQDLQEVIDQHHTKELEYPLSSYVLQKYIENPLLLEGHKFDIRQWVLIKSLHPLKIYYYSEAYCRLSTKLFDIHNLSER